MKTLEFEMNENGQGYIPEQLFGAAFVTDLDSDISFSSFDIKIMQVILLNYFTSFIPNIEIMNETYFHFLKIMMKTKTKKNLIYPN